MKGIMLVRNEKGTERPIIDAKSEQVLNTRWGAEGWKKNGTWKSSKEQFASIQMRVRTYLHFWFNLHYRLMIEEFDAETGRVTSHGYECFFCWLQREYEARVRRETT